MLFKKINDFDEISKLIDESNRIHKLNIKNGHETKKDLPFVAPRNKQTKWVSSFIKKKNGFINSNEPNMSNIKSGESFYAALRKSMLAYVDTRFNLSSPHLVPYSITLDSFLYDEKFETPLFLRYSINNIELEPSDQKEKCLFFWKKISALNVTKSNIADWSQSIVLSGSTWDTHAILLNKLLKLSEWFQQYGNADKLLSAYHKYLIEINYDLSKGNIPMPDISKQIFKGFLIHMFEAFSVDLLGLFAMHENKPLKKIEFSEVLDLFKNKK